MLTATDTRADPKTFPRTVGMVEKKPPFAAPLIITKMTRGPMEREMGHRTRILIVLSSREMNKVLSDPSLSHANPHESRPIADEKLKAATKPAPALDGKPREFVYSGRKKAGTKSGNVPIAPVAKRRAKRMSRKRLLDTSLEKIPVKFQWSTSCHTILLFLLGELALFL